MNRRLLIVVFALLAGSSPLISQEKPADPKPVDPQSADRPGSQYSGMYSFLKEGEFVQVTVEDAGHVTGFVSRFGDQDSDKGVFLDQFFKAGKLDGDVPDLHHRACSWNGVRIQRQDWPWRREEARRRSLLRNQGNPYRTPDRRESEDLIPHAGSDLQGISGRAELEYVGFPNDSPEGGSPADPRDQPLLSRRFQHGCIPLVAGNDPIELFQIRSFVDRHAQIFNLEAARISQHAALGFGLRVIAGKSEVSIDRGWHVVHYIARRAT